MSIPNRNMVLSFAFISALISTAFIGPRLLAKQTTLSAHKAEDFSPIELKPIGIVPSVDLENRGIYLNNAYSISIDHETSFLIANSKEGNILRFDIKGDYLSQVGRFGQAPGEFEFPTKVCAANGSFFVLDSLRSCITAFDKTGIYKKQIKLFRSYSDFDVDSHAQIVAARGTKDISDFLIDVLDDTGKLLFSFGAPINNNEIPFNIANTIRIAVDAEDNIVIMFQLLARIQKYSKDGSLLHDIQLASDTLNKDLNYNRKQFKTIQKGERVGYHRIIEAIRIKDNSYHLLRNGYRRVEIFEVDATGKTIRSYFYPANEDYYAMDFDLIKKGNELTYYILEASPECRIGIYPAR